MVFEGSGKLPDQSAGIQFRALGAELKLLPVDAACDQLAVMGLKEPVLRTLAAEVLGTELAIG